jgi:hypothetical protein
VVFASAPPSGALIDAIGSLTPGSSSSGGGLALAAVQTANLTASAGYIYPINTSSGPVYVTLPASPTAGQQIAITDYAGTFATNNCIINPNGNKITGVISNVTLNVNREGVAIVYVDSTQGWLGYGNFINTPVVAYSISYLVVAGGGGGGGNYGGGGGAGGLLTGTIVPTPSTTYTITVGSGGSGSSGTTRGVSGGNSIIAGPTTITAYGGGGGGADGTPRKTGGNGIGWRYKYQRRYCWHRNIPWIVLSKCSQTRI